MTDQSFMFRLLVAELCHDRSKVKNGTLTVAYHFQVQFAAGAWSRSIAATDPNAWPCNWGPLLCYCMSETSTMWGGFLVKAWHSWWMCAWSLWDQYPAYQEQDQLLQAEGKAAQQGTTQCNCGMLDCLFVLYFRKPILSLSRKNSAALWLWPIGILGWSFSTTRTTFVEAFAYGAIFIQGVFCLLEVTRPRCQHLNLGRHSLQNLMGGSMFPHLNRRGEEHRTDVIRLRRVWLCSSSSRCWTHQSNSYYI